MRPRCSAGTVRWSRLTPATSTPTLPTPASARNATTTATFGTTPASRIPPPHATMPAPKAFARLRLPTSPSATTPPRKPPRPIAAVSQPTPGSPRPRTSNDAATTSTASMPRTRRCPTKQATTRRAWRSARSSPNTASGVGPERAGVPGPASASAGAVCGLSAPAAAIPATLASATTIAAVPAMNVVATEPPAASSNAATDGPASAARLSPVVVATFAATSSSGDRASAGMSAARSGRSSAAATASTAARAKIAAGPTSLAISTVNRRTHATRKNTRSLRSRSLGIRSARDRISGVSTTDGNARRTATIATAVVPPASNANTRSPTRYAASAAIHANDPNSRRSSPGLATSIRTASTGGWTRRRRLASTSPRIAEGDPPRQPVGAPGVGSITCRDAAP